MELKICLNEKDLKEALKKSLRKGYKIISYDIKENDYSKLILKIQDLYTNDFIRISLFDNDLKVNCVNKTLEFEVKKAIVDLIVHKYPELEKIKENFDNLAEDSAKTIEENIKKSIYNINFSDWNGLIKSDSKISLVANNGQIKFDNHVTFRTLENPYYYKDRKIKIKDIYFADLNPVVGDEFGGKRPVVILGRNSSNTIYYCVPLTDKYRVDGVYIGNINNIENYAIPLLKAISPQRIFNYAGCIDNKTYSSIQNKLAEEMLYEDGEQEEVEYESSISYDKLRKVKDTLSNKLDLFPIKKISKEEMYEILNQEIINIENEGKIRFARETVDGEKVLKYKLEYSLNGDIIFCLNPNSNNTKNKYYPRNYSFSLFSVKRNDPLKSNKYVYDKDLSIRYRLYMIKNNENYFLHLIKFLCNYFKNGYDYYIDKHLLSDAKGIQEYIEEAKNNLKQQFEEVGIFYDGSYESLVQSGFFAFDISKLRPIEAKNIYNCQQTDEDRENE